MTHRNSAENNLSIVGVRFRDSSRIHFFTVEDPGIGVDTWVVVPTPDGDQIARVVVAPEQVVCAQLNEQPIPIVRVLMPHDEEFVQVLHEKPLRAGQRGETRLIGGLGSTVILPSPFASQGVSLEDQHYRKMKQGLPMPGERVSTCDGEGVIANVDVFKGLATVRYDDPAGEQTYPVDDVIRSNS